MQALIGFRPVNARIMVALFGTSPFNISVDSPEEQTDLSYTDLTKIL